MIYIKKLRRSIPVLLPHTNLENLEAIKAKEMFVKFLKEGSSYNDISKYPDYMSYASGELLAYILPDIIKEMLLRKDYNGNYLIYQILAAIDPNYGEKEYTRNNVYVERFSKIREFFDTATIKDINTLLFAIKDEPPLPLEEIERISVYWKII